MPESGAGVTTGSLPSIEWRHLHFIKTVLLDLLIKTLCAKCFLLLMTCDAVSPSLKTIRDFYFPIIIQKLSAVGLSLT